MSRMICRNRSLASRLAEHRHRADCAARLCPTRKNSSVAKNSSSSPAAGVTKATTGRTTFGAGSLTLQRAAAAEQRVLQFVQRRERRVEHRELLLDGGADLRRAADPFAHRSGDRGHDQATHAKRDQENEDAGDPGRNAVALRRLDQRRQRQRDHRRGQDRQHEGVADIKKGAEQQQEYADSRGLAGRRPNLLDAVDRLRVADHQRVARLRAWRGYIPQIPSVAPRPPSHYPISLELTPGRRVRFPARADGLSQLDPFRTAIGLLEGAAMTDDRTPPKRATTARRCSCPRPISRCAPGLPQKEPEILARWQKLGLYEAAARRRQRAGRASCSTTARPTPTATSISGTRSTRSSRTW